MVNLGKGPEPRRRNSKYITTSSGKTLKLNRNFGDRAKARKSEREAERALYLSTLPKNRWMRLLYRMHPKRMAAYWFSREGALMGLKITGIGIVVVAFLTIGVFAYFRKDLPKIKGVAGDKLGGSITYYDSSGQTVLWQDYDAVKRIPVESDQISQHVKNATIAIEDKNFYKHGAFDVMGISRAAYNDVFGDGPIQGGSTITQQLVKLNEQWTNNRTITRKIKELILAVELEREYSKNEILTGYLNAAPYGGMLNGVEAAAQDYFGIPAKNLTLAQSAFLAAIPQSPSYYSPYSSPKWNSAVTSTDAFGEDDLIGRAHYIIDQMVDQEMITSQQAEDAKNVDVLAQVHPIRSKYNNIKAPYFVLSAKQQLEQKYGTQTLQRGGWKVRTTLKMDLQSLAEKEVSEGSTLVKRSNGDNIAFVAEDVETGQIVSLVGGIDFNNSEYGKLNFAQIPLPPGSSFKPYDFVALVNEKNAGAGSVLYDSQGPLEGYPCTNKNDPRRDDNSNCLWNYDFKYPGPMTLRYALGGSRNVPSVKAMLTVTPKKTIQIAEAMMNGGSKKKDGYGYNCFLNVQLTRETQCYGSSAIGDGAYLHLDEHVNGLATMSRLGKFIPRTYILNIEDAIGKTIYEWKQPKGKQVVKADSAFIINDIMSDPKASYLRASRKFHNQSNGWKFAIKTGTTNDNFDGLMTSWSTKYAVVTWVGHHTRNVELRAGGMEAMTEPIVRGWMEAAHKNLPAKNWTKPTSVKTEAAYVMSSGFGTGAVMPSPANDFFPAGYTPKSGGTRSAVIDRVSGKLATDCTPAAARMTIGNGNANTFSVDQFVGGSAARSNVTERDDVHKCGDAMPSVTITAPAICMRTCTFSVTPFQGTHALSSEAFPGKLVVKVNGQEVGNFTVSSSGTPVTVDYQPDSTGTVTITAVVTDSVLYSENGSATMNTAMVRRGNGGGWRDTSRREQLNTLASRRNATTATFQ